MRVRNIRPVVGALALALGVSGTGWAQTAGLAAPAVRDFAPQWLQATGLRIEILGLRRWTPAALRDSVRAVAPRQSFGSPTLATTLTKKVNFLDALALPMDRGDSGRTMVLAVIEPGDSTHHRWRTLSGDSTRSAAPWASLVRLTQKASDFELLHDALEAPIYGRVVGRPPVMPVPLRVDTATVLAMWDTLRAHRSPNDLAQARQLLTTSPNPYDRLSALAVLSNFERQDSAWFALVGALLDPDDRVRGFANDVLATFAAHAARRIDWQPAAAELHALLNGTSLAYTRDLLDVLVVTGVAPGLANALLQNGGHGVLLFAASTRPEMRRPSYRFLRLVSGGQSHVTVGQWQAWIAGLRS